MVHNVEFVSDGFFQEAADLDLRCLQSCQKSHTATDKGFKFDFFLDAISNNSHRNPIVLVLIRIFQLRRF